METEMMNEYELQRLENLREKEKLLADLQLGIIGSKKSRQFGGGGSRAGGGRGGLDTKSQPSSALPPRNEKKRKSGEAEELHDDRGDNKNNKNKKKKNNLPIRASTRIASAAANTKAKPEYEMDDEIESRMEVKERRRVRRPETPKRSVKPAKPSRAAIAAAAAAGSASTLHPLPSTIKLDTLRSQSPTALLTTWSSWTPSAPPPTRSPTNGTFDFASHPTFHPNQSPAEILRAGAFGGSYFRPIYSKTLGLTIPSSDWLELPWSWTDGLDVPHQLTSSAYDARVNKYGVACGQSIEEWEAAGWIHHGHDVRGWFQWYCRFFMGRRCADDQRQVRRWDRCVGPRGRWRRMLLKRYVTEGVRRVWDPSGIAATSAEEEGEQEEDEDNQVVSPVMHQTCLHWAWRVTQEALDSFWRDEGGGHAA